MNTVTERDKRLLKRAKAVLYGNLVEGTEGTWKGKCVIPAFGPYKGLWNWDSAFHARTLALIDGDLAYNQIHAFFDIQKEDGMFPDALWAWEPITVFDRITKPPVMAWAFAEAYKRCPKEDELGVAYEKFVANEKFWVEKRSHNGLFHYDCCDRDDEWQKYSKYESGWDTSPRFDKGCDNLWCVDLNCFMVMTYRALAFIAEKLGKAAESNKWIEKADALSDNIVKKLWDDDNKCFYDYDYVGQKFSGILSPASFMPLYVGIATEEQAKCMAKYAANADFEYPAMPTVAYSDKSYSSSDYWRGPTWLNVAYYACVGLRNYGYEKLFDEISDKILNWCDVEETGIYEYYDSKTGKGCGAKDFSWSACFIIEFIKEINKLSNSEINALLK